MGNMDYKSALSKAMRLCSRKEVCKSEIVQKCKEWNLEESNIQRLITELEKQGFIDEERYAEAFVKDKFRFNKWGKQKIESHLRFKKIEGQIITQALSTIDPKDYLDMIEKLAESKIIKVSTSFEQKQKMVRYLVQKGFELDLIYQVLD